MCCLRDCVSRHNGGSAGAPLKPLRDDSGLRALSSLRGLRGAPEVPSLCRETSVSRTANVGTVGMNGLMDIFSLQKHQQKYELCPHFDAEHFGHWFLPREGVIDSYVVENEGQITGILDINYKECKFHVTRI